MDHLMPNRNFDDIDWTMLRADFPTTEKFCYLNLANKAILPRSVEASMQSWLGDIYENAGAAAFSMDEIERTRAQVADTFGAPKECIALVKNTSETSRRSDETAASLRCAPGWIRGFGRGRSGPEG